MPCLLPRQVTWPAFTLLLGHACFWKVRGPCRRAFQTHISPPQGITSSSGCICAGLSLSVDSSQQTQWTACRCLQAKLLIVLLLTRSCPARRAPLVLESALTMKCISQVTQLTEARSREVKDQAQRQSSRLGDLFSRLTQLCPKTTFQTSTLTTTNLTRNL